MTAPLKECGGVYTSHARSYIALGLGGLAWVRQSAADPDDAAMWQRQPLRTLASVLPASWFAAPAMPPLPGKPCFVPSASTPTEEDPACAPTIVLTEPGLVR